MPLHPREISNLFPYHITNRCINKEWFRVDLDYVWNTFCDLLWITSKAYNIKIHSFVLMPNHYHLLASTPNANLPSAMNYLQREVARTITQKSGRINQTFGGRYKSCLIESYHYYLNAYKYIYYNPVKGYLVNRCEEYKYSTLNGILGLSQLIVPLAEDPIIFDRCSQIETTINWLNRTPKQDHLYSMQKALRRKVFKLPRSTKKTKKNDLEWQVL